MKTQSVNFLAKFQFFTWWGGGGSWVIKTQSANYWPNFNFLGGGEVEFLGSQNSKFQLLAKIQFFFGGGGGILG